MAEFSALDVVLNPAGAGTQNDNVVIGRDVLRYVSVFDQIATTTTTIVRYRMRGYRVAISDYEYWIATDPNASPPSGNALVAITIEARIV